MKRALSQCDTETLYDVQIDNGVRQCVNSSLTGIFKNKFVLLGQLSDPLHSFPFQIFKNGRAAM